MDRIARIAGSLRWAILAAAVFMALIPAIIGVLIIVGSPAITIRLGDRYPAGFPVWLTGVGIAVYCWLLAYALARLAAMMRAIRQGGPFSVESVGHLKEFARFWLLSLVAGWLGPVLAELAYGLSTGTSMSIALGVEPNGLASLLVALCLFLVVRLLDEARRVAEDYGQIV